jgi:hypothetical protein
VTTDLLTLEDMVRLTEIRARVKAATPGPGEVSGPHSRVGYDDNGETLREPNGRVLWIEDGWHVSGPEVFGNGESGYMTLETAIFIAATRFDVPWLLALVDRLLALANRIDRD